MKKLTLLLFILPLILMSCSSSKEPIGNPMSLTDLGTTSCLLIEKDFTNKGGKVTEYKELYLRCSVQDYFIKICESNVSLEDLKPYIGKGITVDMEVKMGMWDHCNENPAYDQSRTGPYAVIKSIVK